MAAAAVVAYLNGQEPGEPAYTNTCYSLLSPEYGISVAGVYQLSPEKQIVEVPDSGGVSPPDGNRQLEAVYAQNWFANIMADAFS